MLFDLTFPCYLTTFSGKKCLSGKVIFAFFCPAYRRSPVRHPNSLRYGCVGCLLTGNIIPRSHPTVAAKRLVLVIFTQSDVRGSLTVEVLLERDGIPLRCTEFVEELANRKGLEMPFPRLRD
jgi:hypothetical protein